MKFEYLLQLYWSKGILINGGLKVKPLYTKFFQKISYGFSFFFYKLYLKRFESLACTDVESFSWSELDNLSFNIWLSTLFNQFLNLKAFIEKTIYINYLKRLRKSKRQALGLPSRGQRSWSNAWTAYYNNNTIKFFLNKNKPAKVATEVFYKTDKRVKLIKKKNNTYRIKTIKKKKIINWFI